MTLAESQTQLNNQRKRRENDVWREWYLLESQGKGTPEALRRRSEALEQIRRDYERDSSLIEREFLAAQQAINIQPQEIQKNPAVSTPTVQPETIIKKPSTSRQGNSFFANQLRDRRPQNEPTIVRRSREINEAQALQDAMPNTMSQVGGMYDPSQDPEILRQKVEIMDEELALVGTTTNEVLGTGADEELVGRLQAMSKTMKTSFPIAILVVALGKDVIEFITPFLELIPVVGQALWVVAGIFSILFSGVVWLWLLATSSVAQRAHIKKFVEKRITPIAIGIGAEAILQFIPTTTILVFMIAKERVKLAKAIRKAEKRGNQLMEK